MLSCSARPAIFSWEGGRGGGERRMGSSLQRLINNNNNNNTYQRFFFHQNSRVASFEPTIEGKCIAWPLMLQAGMWWFAIFVV